MNTTAIGPIIQHKSRSSRQDAIEYAEAEVRLEDGSVRHAWLSEYNEGPVFNISTDCLYDRVQLESEMDEFLMEALHRGENDVVAPHLKFGYVSLEHFFEDHPDLFETMVLFLMKADDATAFSLILGLLHEARIVQQPNGCSEIHAQNLVWTKDLSGKWSGPAAGILSSHLDMAIHKS